MTAMATHAALDQRSLVRSAALALEIWRKHTLKVFSCI